MEATEEILPKITMNKKKREISEDLKDLIDDRGKALLQGEIEKAKELNKEAVKQRKRERKIEQLESVKKRLRPENEISRNQTNEKTISANARQS